MNLAEFFDIDTGSFARAFAALREALTKHALEIWKQERNFSPWTLSLGKGGPKPDGGYYPATEQSLYRHCMEVAVLAVWFFYHKWQAGRLPLRPQEDPEPALRQVFAIAFAHDAEKLAGEPSQCPKPHHVHAAYEMLSMEKWSGLSEDEVYSSIVRVENRCLGQAVFAPPIALLTELIAKMVRAADSLVSRAAREDGGPVRFVEVFNADLSRLEADFSVPNRPLRLISFRHHPIVLHELHDFLTAVFYEQSFYPLIFMRQGGQLDVTVPEGAELGPWLDEFEAHLSEHEPGLKVAATTSTVTLFHVHSAQDALKAVRRNREQALRLLAGHVRDTGLISPFVRFWVASGGPPVTAKEPAKPDQKIYPLLGLAGGEGIPEEHPFWRAAILAAVIGEGGGHEAEARLQRLLDRQNELVRRGLGQNGVEAGALDKITLRSVAALQAALLTVHEPLETLLDEIRGQWQQADHGDPGAAAIVQRLRAQASLNSHLAQDGKDDPYRSSARGGCCLLCGAPTLQAIESNRMSLAGIKSSAFSNRIGHEKHLWSERGENYICLACLHVQGMMLKLDGRLTEMPLLVATPVRHLMDTRTPNHPQELLRSFDAASSKPEMIRKLFPWEADSRYNAPLLFEERPTSIEETVAQMHRFARYCALSGEPVHAFLSAQRECRSTFLYEPVPASIKGLFDRPVNEERLMDEEGGVSRKHLARLINCLELFKAILAENEGMNGMQAMPRYRWWAAAFVFSRAAKGQPWDRQQKRFLEIAKKEYPMTEYDEILEKLVALAAETHRPRSSGSEWTLIMRTALEVYQNRSPWGREATIPLLYQRLRSDLLRRYRDSLYMKGLDDRLQKIAETAYELLAQGEEKRDLDAGFVRNLLGAYEGWLRMKVGEMRATQNAAKENPQEALEFDA